MFPDPIVNNLGTRLKSSFYVLGYNGRWRWTSHLIGVPSRSLGFLCVEKKNKKKFISFGILLLCRSDNGNGIWILMEGKRKFWNNGICSCWGCWLLKHFSKWPFTLNHVLVAKIWRHLRATHRAIGYGSGYIT